MSTFERLVEVFNTVFEDEIKVASVTPESTLQEDIGITSIGLLYMVMALEEEFEIKFTNEDFVGIKTVGDVARCIDAKL